ncbi:unknown [[Mannheimia] succiniciproducens MBEL55E]|uniref:Uncharacterized protein n=1 Tax=Mannheimia succiniciproducens (strain KCTC 0769BP / MBEL55E) TaxID=221988 RepID=Q65VB1_MANSM|nr:unknown [[Mannheimia] succiniciproducens MBEL55E]
MRNFAIISLFSELVYLIGRLLSKIITNKRKTLV